MCRRPATFAAERLDGGRGIDIGDRHDRGNAHLIEVVPAHLELLGIGHVRHRASGREIRQDHLLTIAAQDIGALGHEMDAAKYDELGLRVPTDLLSELVRVAGVVGELDDLIPLIVMAEDDQPAAERNSGGRDARIHVRIGQTDVALGQRLRPTGAFSYAVRTGSSIKVPVRFVKLFQARVTKKPSPVNWTKLGVLIITPPPTGIPPTVYDAARATVLVERVPSTGSRPRPDKPAISRVSSLGRTRPAIGKSSPLARSVEIVHTEPQRRLRHVMRSQSRTPSHGDIVEHQARQRVTRRGRRSAPAASASDCCRGETRAG